MLPNFLHIGAPKAASSWLWQVCKEHPEIFVPESPDNVNFFTVHFHRGLGWYEETYFSGAQNEPAVGEFSNSYMMFEPALDRIAAHLPEAKLTLTLRHPVERAWLQWAHIHLKKGKYGFDPANEIGIPFEKTLHHHGHQWFRNWMEPGLYSLHLKRIYERFPGEQVLVMFYDDLARQPGMFLKDYFSFLGVDAEFESSLVGRQINPDAAQADPHEWVSREIWNELHDVFRDDISELQELTGRNLNDWLQP
ncbi:MAG: sulfotransferase [Planctomycetota bacterium]|jgi:hypothetical protein|nr:sulfotransferase [Planctomycetota bacterium]MDP7248802.1 sulfotransferase [Planctomycetota bacterium]